MMTDTKKRQESLTILQRLRHQGLPSREEKMDSMFDSITGSDGGEQGEDETSPEPEYELESPSEQEQRRAKEKQKLKGPNLDPGKVEKFKKGFFGAK